MYHRGLHLETNRVRSRPSPSPKSSLFILLIYRYNLAQSCREQRARRVDIASKTKHTCADMRSRLGEEEYLRLLQGGDNNGEGCAGSEGGGECDKDSPGEGRGGFDTE